jgi:hypothetical protein
MNFCASLQGHRRFDLLVCVIFTWSGYQPSANPPTWGTTAFCQSVLPRKIDLIMSKESFVPSVVGYAVASQLRPLQLWETLMVAVLPPA